jgi:hypothetical protein
MEFFVSILKDEDMCPIISSIDDLSPASYKATLLPGLRVLRINSFAIQQSDPRSLDTISKALLQGKSFV